MNIKIIKKIAKLAILSGLILAGNSFAKDGEKYGSWESKCVKAKKKSICGITQTVFDKNKKPVLNIFIRKVKGQKSPLAFIKVPLLVNLQAGVGIAVDKKEVGRVHYSNCDPAGCNAIVSLDKKLKAAMQKGSKMQVVVFLGKKAINGNVSLSGVTKALESLK